MKPSRSPLRAWARKYGIGACFYMPFFLLFCLFTIIPVFVSMFMSLTDYDMLGHADFIGMDNYANLFLHDGNFLLALKNTFLIGGVSGVIGYLASFLFAWVINNMKLKKLYDEAADDAARERAEQAARWGLAALDNAEEVAVHEDK